MARNASKRKEKIVNEPIEKPQLSGKLADAYEAALKKVGGDSWQPTKPGECRHGKVLSLENVKTKFGNCQVLHGKTPSGENWSIMLGTVLAKAVKTEKVKVGDSVMIVFSGYGGGQKGRPARLFGLTKL